MNTAVARLPNTAPGMWTDKQIELIKRTVAKDCDTDSKGNVLHLGEFDWFMSICRSLRLDPLRRQIYAFVMSKDKPDKRQMVPVIGIGGYRSIAERTGNYRPGDAEITFDERLKNEATNPAGIVSAKVTVFKRAHGEWFPFSETAYWEEFAPIKEVWNEGRPTGRFELDRKKDGWRKMPRLMIEKCAEAKALRRGWPDDFAGTYAEGELDRAEVLDLTATEMAEKAAAANRLALVGGADAMIVQWDPNGELARVPVGKFVDEALKWAHDKTRKGVEITDWQARNRVTLQEFWARHKGDALSLRDALGERLTELAETEAKKATTDETPQAQAIKADERAGQGCHG